MREATHLYSQCLGTQNNPEHWHWEYSTWGEVGGWGRDPKKCTGRDWGMGSSTIYWALRPIVKYHLRRGVGLIKFLENGSRPQPPTSPHESPLASLREAISIPIYTIAYLYSQCLGTQNSTLTLINGAKPESLNPYSNSSTAGRSMRIPKLSIPLNPELNPNPDKRS